MHSKMYEFVDIKVAIDTVAVCSAVTGRIKWGTPAAKSAAVVAAAMVHKSTGLVENSTFLS